MSEDHVIISKPVREIADPLLDLVEKTYTSSFPEEERRDFSLVRKLLEEDSRFEMYALLRDGIYVGFITGWQFEGFVYAEHFAHVIHVHTTAGKTLATRQPFKTFTEPLKEDSRFFICGRGVVVNLEHAEDFEDDSFRMEDGSRIYVSQELQKSARQVFMEFLLQRGHTA